MKILYRILCILILISSTVTIFGQEYPEGIDQLLVNWEVGTVKTLYQTDSIEVKQGDQVLLSTISDVNYKIKIVDKDDLYYTVEFQQIVIDDDVEVESEMVDASPIESAVQQLMADLAVKMQELTYSFHVDVQLGVAIEMLNEEALMEDLEELVVVMLNSILDARKIEVAQTEKDEMIAFVKAYVKQQMPAGIQTMLNNFNYIFQLCATPYLPNDEYNIQSVVQEVDQVNYGDIESIVVQKISSKVKGNELFIKTENLHDPEEAFNDYVLKQGNPLGITVEQFSMTEESMGWFDLETTWITQFRSRTTATMGEMVTLSATTVVIK